VSLIRQHHASSQGFQATAEFLRATRQSAIASSLRTCVLVTPMLFFNRVRELPSREGQGPASRRSPSMSQQVSFGQLALIHCGKFLPLEVMQSAAGHYIGTRDTEGPVSRESQEYLRSYAAAQRALERGGWSQLAFP
jgi:hypothetical protein